MACQPPLDHLSSESLDFRADSWEGVGGMVPSQRVLDYYHVA